MTADTASDIYFLLLGSFFLIGNKYVANKTSKWYKWSMNLNVSPTFLRVAFAMGGAFFAISAIWDLLGK